MRFSAFAPFGMFKFSSKPTRAEQIYRSMYAAKVGAFDLTKGSYHEGKLYAQAMGMARARYALERAFNNGIDPYKSIELLPSLEANWSVFPSETDTVRDRQANVAAAMMRVRGAVREAIVAGLQAILKTHYIHLRTFSTSEVVTDMPTGSAGPLFARPDLPFKLIRLTSPIATTGTPVTAVYENADPSSGPIFIQKNDVLMVQPENVDLAEVVTVSSASVAGEFIATFTKAHDVGAYATTQNWVNWTSTQRHFLIVVDNFAALDNELVRRVNDFMSKVTRGVSTWDIVQPTTPGASTMGPFELGVSPLGAVTLASTTVIAAAPPNFELLPSSMTTSGGLLRIFGQRLLQTTDVTIDGVSAPFTIVSDYQIDVTVPPTLVANYTGFGPPLTYPVVVLSPTGNVTRYLTITPAPLVVATLIPNTGPPGTCVATGTGFLALTDIAGNGFTLTTPWTVVNDTLITNIVPDAIGGGGGLFTLDFTDSMARTFFYPFLFTS